MNILEAIKFEQGRLEKQISKLQRELHGLTTAARMLGDVATDGIGPGRKRVLSAAGRARISAAAKRRWAKVRAGAKKVAFGGSDGPGKAHKRVMSAAARAKISQAMKQRWAKVRAGARKAVR